jgi:hypothetical protein
MTLSKVEPRIRFNWGFWDRRNLGRRTTPLPKDVFYKAGWEYGGYTNYKEDDSSELAWKDFKGTGKRRNTPHRNPGNHTYRGHPPEPNDYKTYQSFVEAWAKWRGWTVPQVQRYFKSGQMPITKRLKQARAIKPNPRRGVLIYGRVLKVFAQKTAGPFKGQRFVHTFKPGAVMVGMPDGSLRITHP